MIETVRISEKGKSQLIQIKRRTGIENWNVICRWALCISLAEPTVPPFEDIPVDSNIEMTWKIFSGQHDKLYEALIKQRIVDDQLPLEELGLWFRIHLHRGISFLHQKRSALIWPLEG